MTVAALNPYPSYRDSGLPWLGNIPQHWTMSRAKYLFREVDDRSATGNEELLSVSHLTGVTPRREKNVTMFMAESNAGHKLCRPGDLVINTMWAWMAALGVSAREGLVSPSYGVYRPLSADLLPGYTDHLLRTSIYAAEYTRRSTGVNSSRLRLYPDQFLRIPIIVPPKAEQEAIARFIGRLGRLIGFYIQAKRQLLSLLGEERQVIVDQTLGGGGVEAQRNRQKIRLKYVATVQTGLTLGKDYGSQELLEYPYLRVANVQSGALNLSEISTVRVPRAEAKATTLQAGDVLMTEGGDIDKLGRGCVWLGEIEDCLHQNHVFAVRPKKGILLPEYLVTVLASSHSRQYFETTAKKTTNLASTNSTTLGRLPLLLPGIGEQHDVLTSLVARTSALDRATRRAQQEIGLLREYRSRLVTDVVTGRVDIREAVASLPDEDGEPGEISLKDGILEGAGDADLGMDDLMRKWLSE
jgi:type I restriction enzyme, S subunit